MQAYTTAACVSYGVAAVAYAMLSIMLVANWRGRLRGMLLAAASAITAVWSLALVHAALRPDAIGAAAQVLEIVRSGAWFAFLLVLLGYSRKGVRTLRIAALAIAAFCVVLATMAVFLPDRGPAPMLIRTVGMVTLAIIGMVLVEQLFRNIEPHHRWSVKYLCLGLCGMFGYDFYLYSHTLLFRDMDPDVWAARGAVYALVVPLVAVATARNPRWSIDVAVSRTIVFHSTIILGAAAYLVAMAGVGYYIRYIGGGWGGVLQATLLFAAVMMMFVLFFSGTVRAQVKRFLSTHFFTYGYDYRQEWLRFTRMLSEGQPGVRLRERSIEAIADLVDSPAGVLWLAGAAGSFEPVANWNMPAIQGQEPSDGPLAVRLAQSQGVIDITDEGEEAPLAERPAWLRAVPRAWLVVPLVLHDQLLGFIVLARSKSKVRLDWEVSDILSTAGRQAASYLAQFEAAKALVEARQFDSFNRMSAFVVHDLKNLIAQLSLVVSNAGRHKHKPAFQEDMIETIGHSVEKMKRLLLQLRGGYALDPPVAVPLPSVLMRAVVAKAVTGVRASVEVPHRPVTVMAHPERLERALGHLLQNAFEATPAGGAVRVRLAASGACAVVEIADSGCGMSEAFVRERLFKPFESTKAAGMGIGTYEVQQYIRELGGAISVKSRPGHGTVFHVTVPARADTAPEAAAGPLEVHT